MESLPTEEVEVCSGSARVTKEEEAGRRREEEEEGRVAIEQQAGDDDDGATIARAVDATLWDWVFVFVFIVFVFNSMRELCRRVRLRECGRARIEGEKKEELVRGRRREEINEREISSLLPAAAAKQAGEREFALSLPLACDAGAFLFSPRHGANAYAPAGQHRESLGRERTGEERRALWKALAEIFFFLLLLSFFFQTEENNCDH